MGAAVFFLFFIGDKNVFAQVIINEIMWMGSSKSSQDEWIELKNNTSQKIQLNGWQIENLLRGNTTFTFPDEPIIEIEEGGFFLISYYSKADQIENRTILNNEELIWRCNGHPSCASFSLANSNNGDLILKSPSGEEVDRALGDSWPAGKKKDGIYYSMERINPLDKGSNVANWATATRAENLISGVLDKATPGNENSCFLFLDPTPMFTPSPVVTASPTSILLPSSMPTPTLTPTPVLTPTLILTPTPSPNPISLPQNYDNIFLNEVMANPGEGPEWVELYNANNFTVDLENWFLDDLANGGSAPQKFSLMIKANGLGLVNLGRNIFNNTGDEVYLLNSSGQEKDHFSYSKTVAGQSWGKNEDRAWCLQEPSPGEANRGCFIKSPTVTTTPTPIAKAAPAEDQNPEMISILGQSDQPETGRTTSPTLKTYLMAEDNPRPKLRKESSSLPGKNWLPDWLLLSGGVLNFGVGLTRVLRKIIP